MWVVLGWWRSWIGDLDGLFDGVLVVFLWLVLRVCEVGCWMG